MIDIRTRTQRHVHIYARVFVPNTVCVKYFSLRRIILSAISYTRDIKSNEERDIDVISRDRL